MPPNSGVPTGVLHENDDEVSGEVIAPLLKAEPREIEYVWRNIILMGYVHLAGLYGFYLMYSSAKIYTTLFAYALYTLGGLGITAGAHRLWAHKAYKAKVPLRMFLTFCNTLAFQDAVVDWARDHRVHHKFSETDADPHNATRGFFFAHVGWLLCRKHPQVKEKGQKIDLSDLSSDPILAFQKKYYLVLMPLVCFVIPVAIPMYFWNEYFYNAFAINFSRYAFTLNATWLVNSAAHLWGPKPYDKFINPAENLFVAIMAIGEGWHNYHHTFPWDYKTSELGKYRTNFTAAFIDVMAKLGQAYDLKTVSEDVIKNRVHRTGDGTHATWGWGDKDQSEEERKNVRVTHRLNDDDKAQ